MMLLVVHILRILIYVNGEDQDEKDNKTVVSHKSFVVYLNSVFKEEPMNVSKTTHDECILKCKRLEKCQSGNYVREESKCSLFSGNKYATPEKLSPAPKGTDYFVIMSRGCETKKCQNEAVCIPNYQNDTFRCECKAGFYGKYCQFEEKEPYPDWWFKFDGNTINSGKSVNDVQVTTENTADGKGEFTGQPHRAGRYMHCHLRCTKSLIYAAEWTDPDDAIAIAFWIKLDRSEMQRHTEEFQQRSFIAETSGFGYNIMYSNEIKLWLFELYRGQTEFYASSAIEIENTWKWNFIGMMWKDSKLTAFVNNSTSTGFSRPHERNLSPARQLFHPISPCIYDIDDFRVWYNGLTEKHMRMIYMRERQDIWI